MWMIDAAVVIGVASAVVLALGALYLSTCIRVLNEYERGVVFRRGRALPTPKGPGLTLVY